jgi:hypothetical protein
VPRYRTPTSPSDFDRREARRKWQTFYTEIYNAYPLHQDFGGGFSAFLDLLEEGQIDPQFILGKAESYSRNIDPDNLEYVPHLKTWLRNRRFEDEDLFTDQAVSRRQWFKGVWMRGDASAVVNKYGFIYNHPPVPDGVEDLASWHLDQRKLWIAKVANHILHGKEPPD